MFPTGGLGIALRNRANISELYGWVENSTGGKLSVGDTEIGKTVRINGYSKLDTTISGVTVTLSITTPTVTVPLVASAENYTADTQYELSAQIGSAQREYTLTEIGLHYFTITISKTGDLNPETVEIYFYTTPTTKSSGRFDGGVFV